MSRAGDAGACKRWSGVGPCTLPFSWGGLAPGWRESAARARERLLAGATLRAVDYLQAVRWRLQLRDRVAAAFANIDAAITASSMDPACRIDDDEALASNYWRQGRMPFNVTGQPGLVIS